MIKHLWTSIRMLVLLGILTVVVYAAVVTGISQLLFPYQASGSLVHYHGRVIGSKLIGQSFTSPKFFDGRPSAAGYNAAASTASNYGPTNPALVKEVQANMAYILKTNPGVKPSQVPVDLVESSDSGLDPDISVAAAYFQAPRVARLNGLPLSSVRHLVATHTAGRFLGMYGNSYVNVLEINLALLHLIHHRS